MLKAVRNPSTENPERGKGSKDPRWQSNIRAKSSQAPVLRRCPEGENKGVMANRIAGRRQRQWGIQMVMERHSVTTIKR